LLPISGVTDGGQGANAPLAAQMWAPFKKCMGPLNSASFASNTTYELETFISSNKFAFLLLQQCLVKLCARAFFKWYLHCQDC